MRVESLNARVDFNDRRVRALEGGAHPGRAPARAPEAAPPQTTADTPSPQESAETGGGESARRRRRRRRGRRGGVPPGESQGGAASISASTVAISSAEEPFEHSATDEPAPSDGHFARSDAPEMDFAPDAGPREVSQAPASWDQQATPSAVAPDDDARAEPPPEHTDESDNGRSDQ